MNCGSDHNAPVTEMCFKLCFEKLMTSDDTDTINQRKIWDESEPPLLRSEIEVAIHVTYNTNTSIQIT